MSGSSGNKQQHIWCHGRATLGVRPVQRETFTAKRRWIAGDHHLTGKAPEQLEKRDMVGLTVVVAVATCRLAGGMQIGRIAINQLCALEGKVGQETVRTSADQLDRVITGEVRKRPPVEIDPDIAQRRRLALHDRAATKMGFDIGAQSSDTMPVYG